MSEKVKKIRVKQKDGSMSDYIPLGADAKNIDTSNGEDLQVILNKTAKYYDNVAAMKADENLKAGDTCVTLGYYKVNDGGRAEYKIESTSSSQYKETLANNLVATLIAQNEINVLQLGVKNDGSTDISSIVNIATQYNDLYFPAGKYKVSETINLVNNIRGEYYNRSASYYSNVNGDINGTVFISSINFSGDGRASSAITYAVFSIANAKKGFIAKDFTLYCNSNENGIVGDISSYKNVYLTNICVKQVKNAVGIRLNCSKTFSRLCYLNNISVYGDPNQYYNSLGISMNKFPDCRIENLEIMSVKQGIDLTGTFAYGDNWHIWTGAMTSDTSTTGANWWKGTYGVTLEAGVYNNLYIDTAYQGIIGKSRKDCSINNIMIMWDDSSKRFDVQDAKMFTSFNGMVTNLNIYVSKELFNTPQCTSMWLRMSEPNITLRTGVTIADYLKCFSYLGTRYYDVDYLIVKSSFTSGKLAPIAYIHNKNETDTLTFKYFRAQQNMKEIKINFTNGTYKDYNIITENNSAGDKLYISKTKDSNDIYTIYAQKNNGLNDEEWIQITSPKAGRESNLNLVDLNFYNTDNNSYHVYNPTLIDYNASSVVELK